MKKPSVKKLILCKTSLRTLSSAELAGVAAGIDGHSVLPSHCGFARCKQN